MSPPRAYAAGSHTLKAMEWWAQVTWGDIATWATVGVALVAAVIALVFGARAERREGYRPLWVLTDDGVLINRTGEDASNVMVTGEDDRGSLIFGAKSVAPNTEVAIGAARGTRRVFITWVRPTTERMYWWPRSARRRSRQVRQLHRGRLARARAADRKLPQLGNLTPESKAELRWWHWRP